MKWPDPWGEKGPLCSPLEPEDGAPDVEPDALAGASLHHGCFFLPCAAGDESSEVWGGFVGMTMRRRRQRGRRICRERLVSGRSGSPRRSR
jgi:hypothetical protein